MWWKRWDFSLFFNYFKLACRNLCGVGGMDFRDLMSVGECCKGCCCDFNQNVNELWFTSASGYGVVNVIHNGGDIFEWIVCASRLCEVFCDGQQTGKWWREREWESVRAFFQGDQMITNRKKWIIWNFENWVLTDFLIISRVEWMAPPHQRRCCHHVCVRSREYFSSLINANRISTFSNLNNYLRLSMMP